MKNVIAQLWKQGYFDALTLLAFIERVTSGGVRRERLDIALLGYRACCGGSGSGAVN
ncbi:MAG: hypothetical protein PUP91_19720 [Rhizonema sp. PD37]|nr:hypothetical protein [Rhizonema sp. PD37]